MRQTLYENRVARNFDLLQGAVIDSEGKVLVATIPDLEPETAGLEGEGTIGPSSDVAVISAICRAITLRNNLISGKALQSRNQFNLAKPVGNFTGASAIHLDEKSTNEQIARKYHSKNKTLVSAIPVLGVKLKRGWNGIFSR